MEVDIGTAILRATTTFPPLMDRQTRGKQKCKAAYMPPQDSPKPSSRPTSRPSSPVTRPAVPREAPQAASILPNPAVPCLFGDLTKSLSSFTFTKVVMPSTAVFSFPPPPAPSSRRVACVKRPRPSSDVDGPNTASLGSKKRRLRRHLITSRLSQPFCQPASHILNREAAASGDKRFLKLAAMANARRLAAAQQAAAAPSGTNPGAASPPGGPHHPGASEVLRRAAIINRFRLRMCVEASQRGDNRVAVVAANAGLLQLSGTGLQGVVGARFPPSAAGQAPSRPAPPVPALPLPEPVPPLSQPHPLSRAAAVARSSPPSSPKGTLAPPALDVLSAGPKLPSPLLGPRRGLGATEGPDGDDDDDVDDEECAFPTSAHESRYEPTDEPDDVYADFSVIFGGGGSDVDSDEEGYDEFLDDIDGIPYMAR